MSDLAALRAECERLKELLDETSATLDDEEAAHSETLDQWKSALARVEALEAVRSAAENIKSLPMLEEQMHRDFSAGTTNAEDAWRDWAKEKADAWAKLDAALLAAKPNTPATGGERRE